MRVLCSILLCFLVVTPLFGKEPAKPAEAVPAIPLTAAEQKFADLLTGASLVGHFTADRAAEALPKRESYGIVAVKKVAGEKWIVESRMSYKGIDIPIPVPVDVYWAGETPMLQVTDLSIPLVGNGFFARVLFYDDRYAGTWQHGKMGGHLFGKIERTVATKSLPDSTEVPADKAR